MLDNEEPERVLLCPLCGYTPRLCESKGYQFACQCGFSGNRGNNKAGAADSFQVATKRFEAHQTLEPCSSCGNADIDEITFKRVNDIAVMMCRQCGRTMNCKLAGTRSDLFHYTIWKWNSTNKAKQS